MPWRSRACSQPKTGRPVRIKIKKTYFWVIFLFQSFVKCSAYARTGHFEFFKMNCDISYFSPKESRTNGLRLSWLTLRGHFASFRLWRCRKRVIHPGEATKLSTSSCFAIAIACDRMQGPVKLFPKNLSYIFPSS